MHPEHPDNWDLVFDAVVDAAQDIGDRINDWRDSHRQDED